MRGQLPNPTLREEIWTGNPAIGYAALASGCFPRRSIQSQIVQVAGCATPQWLVERPGAIGGVQGCNYILPEIDMVVITFTSCSEAGFTLGSIAENRHFAFDLLSVAACPEPAL